MLSGWVDIFMLWSVKGYGEDIYLSVRVGDVVR